MSSCLSWSPMSYARAGVGGSGGGSNDVSISNRGGMPPSSRGPAAAPQQVRCFCCHTTHTHTHPPPLSVLLGGTRSGQSKRSRCRSCGNILVSRAAFFAFPFRATPSGPCPFLPPKTHANTRGEAPTWLGPWLWWLQASRQSRWRLIGAWSCATASSSRSEISHPKSGKLWG